MTMKQNLLKTIAIGLLAMVGVNAWAGDFIDDATTIKVAGNNASATAGEKKTLTFTPIGTDAKIDFTFTSKTITPGQIFGLVEYSANGGTFTKTRIMKMTIDGNEYEEKSAGSVLNFTLDNGNSVAICSYVQNANDTESKQFVKYYTDNVDKTSYTVTAVTAYVGVATASTKTTVTRLGVYTLGEILELYPELKTKNWQINHQYRLLNDGSNNANNSATNNGTDNGWIETKNNGSDITSLAGCKLFVKAVDPAKLPSNYNYLYFRRLNPSSAATEDIFTDLKDNQVLMLSFGTGSNAHVLTKLPTMHNKLIDFDRNMYNYTFVDGVAPSSAEKADVKGGQSTSYATYSRNLKAGYNSCMMPFKKLANASDIPTGISFFKVNTLSDGKVVFAKMTNDEVTADNAFTNGSDSWTPVIIKAETAGVYTFVGRDGQTTASGYKPKKVGNSGTDPNAIYWVGSFVEEAPMAAGNAYNGYTACYGISTDGSEIKKMKNNTKATYYRAFLADNRPGSAPALSLDFNDGNGTTDISIEKIHGLEMASDGAIYNLQGVRMNGDNLPKGIYVKNGRKFVVK